MLRSIARGWLLALTLAGCSGGVSDATSSKPAITSPDRFIGSWQSITPPYEFIHVDIVSKSSEMGALGSRITFSGLAFDASGHIDGDSLSMPMTVAGSSQSAGTMIARVQDAQTLHVTIRTTAGDPLDLTLRRGN